MRNIHVCVLQALRSCALRVSKKQSMFWWALFRAFSTAHCGAPVPRPMLHRQYNARCRTITDLSPARKPLRYLRKQAMVILSSAIAKVSLGASLFLPSKLRLAVCCLPFTYNLKQVWRSHLPHSGVQPRR